MVLFILNVLVHMDRVVFVVLTAALVMVSFAIFIPAEIMVVLMLVLVLVILILILIVIVVVGLAFVHMHLIVSQIALRQSHRGVGNLRL